jgi:hypothetical protein
VCAFLKFPLFEIAAANVGEEFNLIRHFSDGQQIRSSVEQDWSQGRPLSSAMIRLPAEIALSISSTQVLQAARRAARTALLAVTSDTTTARHSNHPVRT